jgi:hypothetical protein
MPTVTMLEFPTADGAKVALGLVRNRSCARLSARSSDPFRGRLP